MKLYTACLLLILLLVMLAGCGGSEEPRPVPTPAPATPAPAPTAPPVLADDTIRIGFMRTPGDYSLNAANHSRGYFPYDRGITILQNPIPDVDELVRRLGLPRDDSDMINAVVVSFSDFARIHQAGGRLRLVGVLPGAGEDFDGLFLREGLAGHDHLAVPLVKGFVRYADRLKVGNGNVYDYHDPYAPHGYYGYNGPDPISGDGIDNHYLLAWDNTPIIAAMQAAWAEKGEQFTRELAHEIFYPRLVPRPSNAAMPSINHLTSDRLAFWGEFAVEVAVMAVSPDDGYLSYQWYDAVTNMPVWGATSEVHNIFGDAPARLLGGQEYAEFSFFVRVTNTNPRVSGQTTATIQSEVVTIRLVREPEYPYVILEPTTMVRFVGMTGGRTDAIFYDDQQVEIIRELVNTRILQGPHVEFIIVEGHFNDAGNRGYPVDDNLILCQNRANAVRNMMIDMGAEFVRIIPRYNPDQGVADDEADRRSATIRLVGR